MKGLLIKDLKLMKNNGKNLLLVFLIIGTMMGIMTNRMAVSCQLIDRRRKKEPASVRTEMNTSSGP